MATRMTEIASLTLLRICLGSTTLLKNKFQSTLTLIIGRLKELRGAFLDPPGLLGTLP